MSMPRLKQILIPALLLAFVPALSYAAGTLPAETSVTKGAGGEVVMTEETGAIERALESKVRDILDGVIKQDQYAVYVQVSMKGDSTALQAYYEERALQTLPGMPGPDPEAASPTNNKLYSMIQTRKVIVVLDKAVSGDQELVTKDVLKAKLSLNEKKGDILDIRRSEVPSSYSRSPASETPPSDKTENWVRYFLIALAGTLVVAVALLLWQLSLLRERLDSRAKLKADIQLDSSTENTVKPASSESTEEGAQPAARNNSLQDGSIISSSELKEKIIALAVSHPKACSQVARRLMATREGMRQLAVACEAIGFEYTRQLFDTISPGKWRAMGEYLRTNLSEVTKAPVGQILLEIYTEMLAESMGTDPSEESAGPFDFLHKLGDPELKRLFANQAPAHIAFVAAYWETEEMSHILTSLNDSRRKETILNIARLKSLPREVVEQAALRFAERLKVLRDRNELEVDGSEVVAKMLASVDSDTEEELLKFIEREDPSTRDRLRAHYFSFDSIHRVPTEVVLAVVEQMDPSDVTRALVGASDEIMQAVLAVMPPKQRSIVEDDVKIAVVQGNIPKQETSTARKLLVVALRKAMKERGIELSQLGSGPVTPPPSAPEAFSSIKTSPEPQFSIATEPTLSLDVPKVVLTDAPSETPTDASTAEAANVAPVIQIEAVDPDDQAA